MGKGQGEATKGVLPFIWEKVFVEREDNASAIYREIVSKFTDYPSPEVVRRNVRHFIQERQRMDANAIWNLDQADHETVRPVMAALREAIRVTQGRVTRMTNQEAALVAKVQQAAPEMNPWTVWRFAQRYHYRLSSEPPQPVDDLNAVIALWPDLISERNSKEQETFNLIKNLWPDSPLNASLYQDTVTDQVKNMGIPVFEHIRKDNADES